VGCGCCGRGRRGLEATDAVRKEVAERAQKRTVVSGSDVCPCLPCAGLCCCCPLRLGCVRETLSLSPAPLLPGSLCLHGAHTQRARDNTTHTRTHCGVASITRRVVCLCGPLCLSRPA